MKKKLLSLLLALTLLTLTACTSLTGLTEFDATTYVQGLLDETYRGECSDAFLTLVETTEAEVAASFARNLEVEYLDRLAYYFEITDESISEETREGLKELLGAVYARARYEVKGSKRMDDDRYWVEVAITPVTFFADIYRDDMAAYAAEFNKNYQPLSGDALSAMSDAQYEDYLASYEDAWAAGLLELFEGRLGNIAYGDTVTLLVLLFPDPADGLYTISDNDFYNMDKLILSY